MLVTRTSMLTGKVHTLDIPCTQAQLDAWNAGALIQDAMPNVSAEHREFLMTGSTTEEWDALFDEGEYA
ncbi:MAG: hypothetical protein GX856_13970 [Gammaproteobacteria bacterium]|jgi:transcriptional regulator of nitric oxide reductase|nr:hypothetical protein [Gammaproteobacteria bacterium]